MQASPANTDTQLSFEDYKRQQNILRAANDKKQTRELETGVQQENKNIEHEITTLMHKLQCYSNRIQQLHQCKEDVTQLENISTLNDEIAILRDKERKSTQQLKLCINRKQYYTGERASENMAHANALLRQ